MTYVKMDSFGKPLLNIRNELVGSFANGPGNRYVVWFQGCGHGCIGCYNPGSWSSGAVDLIEPSTLAARILSSGCTGVTFTGGEPMSQAVGFLEVLNHLHPSGVLSKVLVDGILLFTGHTLEEISADDNCAACLSMLDVAISGRFIRELRAVRGLLGSTNQEVWWNPLAGRGLDIISSESVTEGQVFETHSVSSGVLLTGFPEIEGLKIPGLRRR